MGENYVRNKKKYEYIYQKNKKDKNNCGNFVSENMIKSPGKKETVFLRKGKNKYNERITLLVDKGYEAFSPFAYLTD